MFECKQRLWQIGEQLTHKMRIGSWEDYLPWHGSVWASFLLADTYMQLIADLSVCRGSTRWAQGVWNTCPRFHPDSLTFHVRNTQEHDTHVRNTQKGWVLEHLQVILLLLASPRLASRRETKGEEEGHQLQALLGVREVGTCGWTLEWQTSGLASVWWSSFPTGMASLVLRDPQPQFVVLWAT